MKKIQAKLCSDCMHKRPIKITRKFKFQFVDTVLKCDDCGSEWHSIYIMPRVPLKGDSTLDAIDKLTSD